MSKKKDIRELAISGLTINQFVRTKLNMDHAITLGELLENGVVLPPILVTSQFVVVDGRHRIEAHDLIGRETISCEIVEVGSDTDLIVTAFNANSGGSLPPSQQDTERTIMLLMDRGEAVKSISDKIRLPMPIVKRYVGQIKSRIARTNLNNAALAVTENGMTLKNAAEKFKVDQEKLKTFLSGNLRKQKFSVADLTKSLQALYKGLNKKTAAQMRKLLDKLEDGEITERDVEEVFKRLKEAQKNLNRILNDWEKRFNAMRKAE